MSAADENLIARRRDLCRRLRRQRETADLTQRQAAAALDWSLSKLVRIETGTQGVSVTGLKAMLALYGVTEPGIIAELGAAARDTWMQPGLARTRIPFGKLMELVGDLTRINGWPVHAGRTIRPLGRAG